MCMSYLVIIRVSRTSHSIVLTATLLILTGNCRKLAKDAEKKGQGGLWGYISGS